jgi:diadenylate cyclase
VQEVSFLGNQPIFLKVIDVLLVFLILYYLFKILKGAKGIFFLNAVLILFLINVSSRFLGLEYFNALLEQIMLMLFVALPIIFQNELKRALEILGGKNPILQWLIKPPDIPQESIEIVAEAVAGLSKHRYGAIIVFERNDPLPMVKQSGSFLDGALSQIFVEQIFYPNSPLHDGAVVIKGNRIQSAGCFLPLDNQLILPQELGSRHRAGLSLANQSDALIIIVSEETGNISVAFNGQLETGYNGEQIKYRLIELVRPAEAVNTGNTECNQTKTEAG